MKIYITLALGALSLTLIGCQTNLPADATACEEPRPEVCTREYRPVCGYLAETEEWKTYGNGCSACADTDVAGWKEGACEGETK